MFLNILHASQTYGYSIPYIPSLAFLSIFLATSIIIVKNPVYSVLFLIGLFLSLSVYYMLLGLYFIGLSYLLVYVGAISILFLFILMLINVRISELVTEGQNSIPLAIIAVLVFYSPVNGVSPLSVNKKADSSITVSATDTELYSDNLQTLVSVKESLGEVNSISWETSLVEVTHITSIGNILYSSIYIYLIITSLILLLAMVGTIVITKGNDISSLVSSPPAIEDLAPKLAGWTLLPDLIEIGQALNPEGGSGIWSGVITGIEGSMGVEIEVTESPAPGAAPSAPDTTAGNTNAPDTSGGDSTGNN